MERAEAAEGAAWLQWRKVARKEHRRERQDGEDKGSGVKIVQEVVAGIKEKASVHDGEKDEVKRPVEQSFMRSWDCSQIENEEEAESLRERDQMAAQWDEEQKNWRRSWSKEGWKEAPCSWRSCERYLGGVVHERMSQGEGVKGFKEKEESIRMVHGRDEGTAKYCCGGRH